MFVMVREYGAYHWYTVTSLNGQFRYLFAPVRHHKKFSVARQMIFCSQFLGFDSAQQICLSCNLLEEYNLMACLIAMHQNQKINLDVNATVMACLDYDKYWSFLSCMKSFPFCILLVECFCTIYLLFWLQICHASCAQFSYLFLTNIFLDLSHHLFVWVVYNKILKFQLLSNLIDSFSRLIYHVKKFHYPKLTASNELSSDDYFGQIGQI